MKFLKEIEFPTNLSAYSKDIFAGLTVAIVALPLAIGFGITSGMSAANGIVTAIVAGFIAALFGGSNWQVSGPTGAMTVVLIPVIAKYGINAIPILGLLSGAMVLVMALLKLGKLINFVPGSVLEGFTVGIAIIITIQQLPYVFDVEKGSGTRTLTVAYKTLINAIDSKIHWVNIFLVVATLLVKFNIVKIIELLKVRIYVPASFAALTLVTLFSLIFNLTIPRIGNIPRAAFEFNFDVRRFSVSMANLWTRYNYTAFAAEENNPIYFVNDNRTVDFSSLFNEIEPSMFTIKQVFLTDYVNECLALEQKNRFKKEFNMILKNTIQKLLVQGSISEDIIFIDIHVRVIRLLHDAIYTRK